VRSFTVACFSPTTSSSSASIISLSTPSPTLTLNASNPSFAAPASSPSASCTRAGKLSGRLSCSCITVFMAVPFVSMD
jgi:hypothetical protein